MDQTFTIADQIERKTSLFDLKALAQLLGVEYTTLWDMQKDGRLPVVRIGSAIRVDPKVIAVWIRERSTSPAVQPATRSRQHASARARLRRAANSALQTQGQSAQ